MARALGTDDAYTSCDCCGKSGLKFTVAIELDCGEIVHYGQVCARRNTNKTQRQINAEICNYEHSIKEAARAELYATAEYKAEQARYAERPRNLIGRAALEFVFDAADAANVVRKRIADKYGLEVWQVY